MKRLIITEEEKSRILGMHQNATKRNYLMEQVTQGTTQSLLTQIANRINKQIENAKARGKQISNVVSVAQEGNYNGTNAFVLKYGNTTFLSDGKGYKFSDGVLNDFGKEKPRYSTPLKFWREGIAGVINGNTKAPKELQQLPDDTGNILKIYDTWANQFSSEQTTATPTKQPVKKP